jgi:DcmR-like sensory protein
MNHNHTTTNKNSHNSSKRRRMKKLDYVKTRNRLVEADFGSHFLVTYPHIEVWKKIYPEVVKKYLIADESMVVVLPSYETTNQVRANLKNTISNVGLHEQNEDLVIIDSVKAYFSEIGLMTFVDGLLRHVKAKSKKGLSVLADMGSFQHMGRIHQLIEHELSLPARYDGASLRGFCVYHQGNFAKLTEQQRQSLYEHHEENLFIF